MDQMSSKTKHNISCYILDGVFAMKFGDDGVQQT